MVANRRKRSGRRHPKLSAEKWKIMSPQMFPGVSSMSLNGSLYRSMPMANTGLLNNAWKSRGFSNNGVIGLEIPQRSELGLSSSASEAVQSTNSGIAQFIPSPICGKNGSRVYSLPISTYMRNESGSIYRFSKAIQSQNNTAQSKERQLTAMQQPAFPVHCLHGGSDEHRDDAASASNIQGAIPPQNHMHPAGQPFSRFLSGAKYIGGALVNGMRKIASSGRNYMTNSITDYMLPPTSVDILDDLCRKGKNVPEVMDARKILQQRSGKYLLDELKKCVNEGSSVDPFDMALEIDPVNNIFVDEVSNLRIIKDFNEDGSEYIIGEGTFSTVTLANLIIAPHSPVKKVALKIFYGAGIDYELIIFESQILSYLSPTGFVPKMYGLVNLGTDDDPELALVQEFIGGGGTLYRYCKPSGSNLRLLTWLRICQSLCVGLHKMHAMHILNNDVKQDNIMIDFHTNRDYPIVKFIDMGNCTVAEGLRYQAGDLLKNCQHIPPETKAGDATTEKSDIFGLGHLFAVIGERAKFKEMSDLGHDCKATNPYDRPVMSVIAHRLLQMESLV